MSCIALGREPNEDGDSILSEVDLTDDSIDHCVRTVP
jgi:hypothetical protein